MNKVMVGIVAFVSVQGIQASSWPVPSGKVIAIAGLNVAVSLYPTAQWVRYALQHADAKAQWKAMPTVSAPVVSTDHASSAHVGMADQMGALGQQRINLRRNMNDYLALRRQYATPAWLSPLVVGGLLVVGYLRFYKYPQRKAEKGNG